MNDEYTRESPWEISEAGFPRQGSAEDQARFLLRYAILAPSARNSQPWKFKVRGEAVMVYADKSRWLKIADQNQRELYISVGCALENFLAAARHFGIGYQVDYLPDPGNCALVARVTLVDQPVNVPFSDAGLFAALVERQTSHQRFKTTPLPVPAVKQLQACCVEPGLALLLVKDPTARQAIDQLAIRADAMQLADPDYMDELSRDVTRGAVDPVTLLGKLHRLAAAALDPVHPAARWDQQQAGRAPLLGLLVSDQDTLKIRVQVGQVFERLWLTATHLGLHLQPMTQALQLPQLRETLGRQTGAGDRFPQQFFRLGYAEQTENGYTPRHPLEDALIGT